MRALGLEPADAQAGTAAFGGDGCLQPRRHGFAQLGARRVCQRDPARRPVSRSRRCACERGLVSTSGCLSGGDRAVCFKAFWGGVWGFLFFLFQDSLVCTKREPNPLEETPFLLSWCTTINTYGFLYSPLASQLVMVTVTGGDRWWLGGRVRRAASGTFVKRQRLHHGCQGHRIQQRALRILLTHTSPRPRQTRPHPAN